VTSGFRREADEHCVPLGYRTASSGNSLPTFRDNLSVRNYHYSLRSNPEGRSAHVYHLLFFHVRPAKQPTIKSAVRCPQALKHLNTARLIT